MSKNKKRKDEEFEDIFADGSLNEDAFDDENGLFDEPHEEYWEDEEYDDDGGDYQEEEGSQNLPTEISESSGIISSIGNTVGNVTNLAKENKLATAGILSAVGFGLWKVFGNKEQDVGHQGQANSVPQSYDDEFLGLDDEDDSIDEFLEEHSSGKINPMFTPLKFK